VVVKFLRAGAYLLACLCGSAVCAGKQVAQTRSTPVATLESPHVELQGARVAEGVGRDKVWELAADRIVYRQEFETAKLAGVKATFFENGRLVSRGEAPSAALSASKHRFELTGGIQVESEDRRSGFTSNGASWEPANGRLVAKGPVSYWGPAAKLNATSLKADRALGQIELAGGVHGTLALCSDGTFKPLGAYTHETHARVSRP
jgi:LPS export ABC transporter protein LptC